MNQECLEEDEEAGRWISEQQHELQRAIDQRHMMEGKQLIDALSRDDRLPQLSGLLNRYIHPHQPATPFLHAVARGNAELALYLLEKGCNPFSETESGKSGNAKFPEMSYSKTLFKLLEKSGFQNVFSTLLEKADFLTVDKNGDTALHIIAKKKLIVIFEVVLRSKWLGKMMKHYNNQGYLPLHVAARSNFIQFFQIFSMQSGPAPVFEKKSLEHDVQPFCDEDIPSGGRCPQSLLASDLKNKPTEASLMNIHLPVKSTKRTALHIAASEKSVQLVELLLQLGANVNCSDECGRTPLVECLDHRGEKSISSPVRSALYEVCRTLLASGASTNVCSHIRFSERRSMSMDDILTPLHLAARIGHDHVVQLLLDNGANPCQLSGDTGKIPAQFALELGHNSVALALLHFRLYPEGFLSPHVDYAFNSLLHSADKCSPEVTELLVQLKCSLDRPNVNHLRPLDKAISSKNIHFAKQLLDTKPCIVNVQLYQDPKAYPPLHLAASSGDIGLCRFLLSYGADIYTRAYGKHPAYRKAFRFNRYETAVFLCEQMSRPFPVNVQEDLHNLTEVLDTTLSQRLKHRLESIPTLVSSSLDVIRQVFIRNYLCFENMDQLPLPASVIRALRYDYTQHS